MTQQLHYEVFILGIHATVSKGHMNPQVYSNTINNSQSMGRAQMSIDG